jgi:LPPG:FO 2-phospho-L-lactate transferase
VRFDGAQHARPSEGFRVGLDRADAVIITPSNPFVSIDPILAIPGVVNELRRAGRPVVAVSPMVGGRAVKGPLGKMMTERELEPSALGVAQHYGELVDGWIVDTADRALVPAIEALGCRVMVRNTMMRTLDDKLALAQDLLKLISELSLVTVA